MKHDASKGFASKRKKGVFMTDKILNIAAMAAFFSVFVAISSTAFAMGLFFPAFMVAALGVGFFALTVLHFVF